MWIYEHQMMYSVGNAENDGIADWEWIVVKIWWAKMIQSEIGVIVFVTMTGGRCGFTRGEYMNPNDDISDWEWFRPAGGCCTEKGDP